MVKHLNNVVSEHGQPVMVVNENNRESLNAIHKYLCYPKGNTGIILWGPAGTGKSITMEAFKRCMREIWKKGLVEYNAPYIRANYYKDSGPDHYTTAYKVHLFRHLIINDMGFERPYSSGEDIIQTIMFDRFERGFTTHGTTNLNQEEFFQRYNDDKNRMLDRFKLMFQFIEVKGESFR